MNNRGGRETDKTLVKGVRQLTVRLEPFRLAYICYRGVMKDDVANWEKPADCFIPIKSGIFKNITENTPPKRYVFTWRYVKKYRSGSSIVNKYNTTTNLTEISQHSPVQTQIKCVRCSSIRVKMLPNRIGMSIQPNNYTTTTMFCLSCQHKFKLTEVSKC